MHDMVAIMKIDLLIGFVKQFFERLVALLDFLVAVQ